MYLIGIRCRFGRLEGQYCFDPERVTLVVEDNEQGKTTLVEAIVVALYGYDRTRRVAGAAPERERYLPVDGGPCFVAIELRANGRHLALRRDLSRESPDVVRVTDLDTAQDATAEFAPTKGGSTPGDALLGLSREQFLNICMVRQGQMDGVDAGGALTGRIQQMVDTSAGQRTAQAAIAVLDDALRRFHGTTFKSGSGQVETEMKRLSDQLLDSRREQDSLRAARDAIDEDARRLEGIEAEDAQDAEQEERLRQLAEIAELAQLQRDRQDREARAERACELEEEIAALDQYRHAPLDAKTRLEAAFEALTTARDGVRTNLDEVRAAEQAVEIEKARLSGLGSVAVWGPDSRDEVLTAQVHLASAFDEAGQAASALQESLRNAGPVARDLFSGGTSVFSQLSDLDRRTLLGYPSERDAAILALERAQAVLASVDGSSKPRSNLPLLAAGGLLLAAGLVLLGMRPILGVVVGGAGAVILAATWALRSNPRVDLPAIERRLRTEHDRDEARARLERLSQEADRLAASVGVAPAEAAAGALHGFLAAQGSLSGLTAQQQLHEKAAENLALAQRRVSDLLTRAGIPAGQTEPQPRDADRLLDLVNRAIEQQQRVTAVESTLTRLRQQLEHSETAAAQASQAWERLCLELDVSAADAQAAEEHAGTAAEQRCRLEQIETELSVLSQGTASMAEEDLERRIEDLKQRIDAAQANDPSLASLAAEMPAADYADAREAVRRHREERRAERQALRDRVGSVLDGFRSKLPAAINAEHDAMRRLAQVQRYAGAVTIASETLQEVARESHLAWAETLNASAGSMLSYLAPNYAAIRFGPQLEIGVLDAAGRAWSPGDGRLSAGCRDRIYLAVRLALAAYCSPEGQPLPLILDDVFVTSDDDRFDAAMRLLLEEVSTHHQVILLSCHRRRHAAFQEANPRLWSTRADVLFLQHENVV